MTTLHGRQDLPDLFPLYAGFPDMKLVSISNAQRKPIPNASFAGTISMLGPGDTLKRTIDLFSCPGIIYLVDPDRAQLKADYDRIRELDAAGAVFETEELVAS